jgi:hypothetical protein
MFYTNIHVHSLRMTHKKGSKRVFYITNEMQLIQCSLLLSALYMFRAVFPPIINGRQQESMTVPKAAHTVL